MLGHWWGCYGPLCGCRAAGDMKLKNHWVDVENLKKNNEVYITIKLIVQSLGFKPFSSLRANDPQTNYSLPIITAVMVKMTKAFFMKKLFTSSFLMFSTLLLASSDLDWIPARIW